jgi:hypothetical protein
MAITVKERLAKIEKDGYPLYQQAIHLLQQSGVLPILKLLARPKSNPTYPDTRNAYEAGFSQGYFQCLDNLELFKETVLDIQPKASPTIPQADYGGIEKLLQEKRITPAEAQTLRDNLNSKSRSVGQ